MEIFMKEINKILIPTDFSKGSQTAYTVAQKIADTFGSRIDLVHIIPTVKYLHESIKKLGVPLDMNKDVYPQIVKEKEHAIQRDMDDYIRDQNKGEIFVRIDRKPSEAIVEHAKQKGYDLIIMGAKGHHETALLRGGTTEKVIRYSKVPVFSVDKSLEKEKIRHVLVPTDSSMLSLAGFPLALAIADTYNADITLLHIIELYGSVSEDIPRSPQKGETISIYEVVIERLKKFLSEKELENISVQRTGVTFEDEVAIADNGDSRQVQLKTKIIKGVSAHYEIESYAEENADIVVMATHGHSGFAHLILGSTAEKVAQYVTKPVITVRPEKHEFED